MRCNEQAHEPTAYRTCVAAKAQTNRGLVEAAHGSWFGAFVDHRLVAQMGLLAAGPELARFQAVETDPDHRRRGLAGSLVYYASRRGFDELGARTLVMVADPDYFAIDLPSDRIRADRIATSSRTATHRRLTAGRQLWASRPGTLCGHWMRAAHPGPNWSVRQDPPGDDVADR